MQHFLVVAMDGTDAEAPARRQAVRPAHLAGLEGMIQRGEVISGGPILNAEGGMIGSTMTVAFPDRAGLDAWLAVEPYVVRDVWRDIDIKPIRLVVHTAPQLAGA